jgi:hypothetical protein
MVDTIDSMTPPYRNGDLVWVENHGENDNATLMIYNGTDWVPVNPDFDPTNELNLVVVADTATRDTQFSQAKVGDQVWNQESGCMQIHNGTSWISIKTGSLTIVANDATRDTQFNPANVGDQIWNQNCNCMQVYDGTNWVSIGTGTGNVTIVADETARDTEFNPAVAGNQVWNQDCDCMQIYDGTNWISIGTGGLIVVANDTARDTEFNPATVGDQVWNQDCECMQVYDGTNWVSVGTGSGVTVVADKTARDTEFNPATAGNQVWNQDCNCMQIYDGTNWISVGTGSGNIAIAPIVSDLDSSAVAGDLAWVEAFGDDNIPTLMIYNGTDWVPVNSDFDPRNELDLTVVADEAARNTQFNPAIVGNQVWNQDCDCMQIYDGTNWVSVETGSGVTVVADDTARDTQFNPATAGDQVWNQDCDCMQIYDGTNWVSVGTGSGNLTVVADDTARDTEFNPATVGNQVWNQDCECMQVYDGTNWVSVGTATGNIAIAPTVIDLDSSAVAGDLAWVETFGNDNIPTLMIYNGTDWVPVNSDFDPRNELDLTVVANETVRDTQFNPAIVGNQVWNQDCGCMQVYDGTNWVSMSSITGASNGLNVVDNTTIKLGGDLINPTVITTSATNTLAIKDLEISTVATDEVVMIEQSSGILKRRSLSSLIQQEQVIIIANNGQSRFTTPLPITDLNKVDVYRNGARISFVMIDATTIELEPEAICYQGDEIRIVQLN